MSTVSFAKVPGAGSSEAVPATPANAELVPPVAGSPAAAPAPQSNTQLAAPPTRSVGFFSGGDDDDDGDDDRSDVKMPRLNLVQGMSDAGLKAIAPEGNYVFNKALFVPAPVTIVVAGLSRKVYSEKPLKFGDKARTFDTLEQVIEAGGTDNWRMSRENREGGDPKKPWFVRMATAVVLIKKWEGIKPEDEEHFKCVADDGTAFAGAVYTLKSTSFTSFYVPLKSANAQGVLTGGYYHRYVKLAVVKKTAFEPQVTILDSTSEAVRKLAKSLLN